MADLDLQEIHDFLVEVAHRAGAMIISANPQDIDKGTKLNSTDIVTECDKAVEAMVSETLRGKYPNISFMGEETYQPGTRLGPEPTFVVDPIDGTTNFVHSFPNACISLGLALDRRPVVGVVYNPFQDLLYGGISGHGAYAIRAGGPKRRLPLSDNPPALGALDTSLVCFEIGADRSGHNFDLKIDVFRKLTAAKHDGGHMVHSTRALGSAALNICAVAAGQLDIYWEGGCWAWDVCAGWCILEEAGGKMVSGVPGQWDVAVEGRNYLCVRAAPAGQNELVEEFWSTMDGRSLKYDM
ncbi:hypothetical protein TD95_004806 [Thielaviopsis punctulata]|uniref:Inositol-1-monophosphatase n=1 Tax=Thielaviopsis punctulata TaxID=72032 RepID=A0A0F4ZIA7_9PEZI|nr:hypothetical protein TD95_004806 [Thielaviopsis punctulata]